MIKKKINYIKKNPSKISKIIFYNIFRWGLFVGISYIILLPIFTKLSISFMSVEDILNSTVYWIPRNPTVYYYRIVMIDFNYFQVLFNTFVFAMAISLLQIFASTITGYGLARFDFIGNNVIFLLVLFTLVVPPYMMMVPSYLNFRYFDIFGLLPEGGLNLMGGYWPFILTSLTGNGLRNGLFIFVMREFFKGMPESLEEAAYVDGAGPFKTFYKIMLPGALPAFVIIFLFSFVWMWGNDFEISLYLSNELNFLPTLLRNFGNIAENYNPREFSILSNAAMLLYIAPLLVLYMFMQQYFVESIERTGIVG